MTSGPGTIINIQVTDALYAAKCSSLERAVLLRGAVLGVRFPPRAGRWSVWLCALSVRLADAELLSAEWRLRRVVKKSCCSLENRCETRFGVFSPTSSVGVTLNCHSGSPAFRDLVCATAKAVAQMGRRLGGFHVWNRPFGKIANRVGASHLRDNVVLPMNGFPVRAGW